jgi:tellurite resistance protein
LEVILSATLRFFLSWWAYSFPLAAITLATLLMYEINASSTFYVLSILLLGLLTLVVTLLFYRTLQAVAAKQVCLPEG